jgi:hypothetical protein
MQKVCGTWTGNVCPELASQDPSRNSHHKRFESVTVGKESSMTKSQNRMAARRAIQERAIARRREREQQDERVARLALDVNVSLREGRSAVEAAELSAGRALTHMIKKEGLSVAEVIDWVGDSTLTAREIARLRGLAAESPEP